MKKKIQIVLYVLSVFFAFMIYRSINAPIMFKKIKKERYSAVIKNLKDIKKSQEAHRIVKGRYINSFDSLVSFVENDQFIITQQRDTSWMEYDKVYRIDIMREEKIIDTLGYVSVKDSLFRSSDDYKKMMYVPFSKENDTFELKAKVLTKSGLTIPVFEAKIKKSLILYDQPSTLVKQELEVMNVEDINGSYITLGSLTEVSTTGNWPSFYDTKREED